MDEAGWEALAYEQIGRIIVAWGRFDHAITAQTWKHNDPLSPWPVGPVEGTFYKRLCRWCSIQEPNCIPASRAAFHAFREDVRTLSKFRDDLAHNTFTVAGHHDGFSVIATRWPKTDWRDRFDRWVAKHGHMKSFKRVEPESGATTHIHYRNRHLAELLSAIEDSRQRVGAIGEAVGRGEQFDLPSTPLIPEGLARLSH